MVKALLLKELKESAWIWLIAIGAYVLLVLEAMHVPLLPGFARWALSLGSGGADPIPFVHMQIAIGLGWISALMAITMGIWQTFGETWRGTFPLLLHLSMPRRQLFGLKLATGLGLIFGLTGCALIILCAWAATPGTHASPFEWSMTGLSWRVWFAAPLFYLAGFTTGLYPTRWLGTRLIPLVTASLTAVGLLIATEFGPFPAWLFVVLILVAEGVYIAVLDHLIRTCDFS